MDKERLYLISDIPGYSPMISQLISMMTYARQTTLDTTANLNVEQLDYINDKESNSIGALLSHMAAVETAYQIITFEGREPSDDELLPWRTALELGERGRNEIHGNTLEYYVDCLETVRAKTLEEFLKRDDAWLQREVPFWQGRQANLYFLWFHVFEDEINHRGQMRYLRKRLPSHD